ncbi:MAG: hypothetical protein IKV40_04645 [Clostridia bacterium]|nr:hypothetical protein [Clostridia bacterium]
MAQKYPFSMWVYNPLSDFTPDEVALWYDCGFTHPELPRVYSNSEAASLIPFLDEAQKRGIKVIANFANLAIPRFQEISECILVKEGSDAYEKEFREAYEIIGSHPALHGFYVADEPARPQFFSLVNECYRIQKKVAPELHPFVNLRGETPAFDKSEFSGKTYEEWMAYLGNELGISFVTLDLYGPMINDNLMPSYFRSIKGAVETSLKVNGPDIWANLLSSAHYAYHVPSESEYRWMVNSSAALGCRGAMWFRFYDRLEGHEYYGSPIDEFGAKSPTYYYMQHAQKLFSAHYGELLMSLRFKCAFHLGTDYKAYPVFGEGSHPLIGMASFDDGIVSFFEDSEGTEYLCLVNMHRDRYGSFRIFYDEEKCKVYEVYMNGERSVYFPPTDPAEEWADFNMYAGSMRMFKIEKL